MSQYEDGFTSMVKWILGVSVALAILVYVVYAVITALFPAQEDISQDAMVQAAVTDRIKTEIDLETGDLAALAAKVKAPSEVYNEVCASCHGSGALGAPKVGDKADWSARLDAAGGIEGLLKSAINGKNSMPARGGVPTLKDEELKGAIELMLKDSDVAL